MTLYLITSNKNKFEELKQLIPEVELLSIDLPEIQEINPQEIIKTKLLHAFEYKNSEFLVEDTSFCLDCLNGLPGPFIK